MASILYAEDNPEVREETKKELQELGHAVHAVADGQAAWEAITNSETGYDLVITDGEMPRMSGIALLKSIHENPAHAIPVIVLTGMGSWKKRVTELGGRFLRKREVESPAALDAVIKEVLAAR